MVRIISRGCIEFDFEGRPFRVPGEALLPSTGGPDFVVFLDMLRSWDYPSDARPISSDDRARVLASLIVEARKCGLTVEA